jgi:hypothetical protein
LGRFANRQYCIIAPDELPADRIKKLDLFNALQNHLPGGFVSGHQGMTLSILGCQQQAQVIWVRCSWRVAVSMPGSQFICLDP